MTRSRRKHPITGWTCSETEKRDKRIANRRLRRRNRELVRRYWHGLEDIFQFLLREISNVYKFDKDGKQKFDPRKHPDLMRK